MQDEPLAAEHAGAQPALQGRGQLHPRCGAQEAVAVHQVAAARLHGEFEDLARHLGGEGHGAYATLAGELRHEQAAA